MKVVNIPLSSIQVPEVRISARYDEELASNLASSLRDVGQLEPIIVVQNGEGYILVDGLHRTYEAKQRGDKTIPAVIHPGNLTQALLLNLATSHNKGKIHPGDVLKVIAALVKDQGLDSDAIAHATGMSREQVERYWRLSESSPLVQHAVSEGNCSLGAAAEIARLPSLEQQEELLAQQVLFRHPVAMVKATVDQVLAIMSEPPTERPIQVSQPAPLPSCQGCQQEVHPGQLRSALLCPHCYGQVYRLSRERTVISG